MTVALVTDDIDALVTPAWCAGFWRGRAAVREYFAATAANDVERRNHLAKQAEYEAAAEEARG